MEITESQINCIVGEVMARMQRNEDTAGMHGIFADMDTAIEKAKASVGERGIYLDSSVIAHKDPQICKFSV